MDDVQNERFISFVQPRPGLNQQLLIGWAGWTDAERAEVLTDLIEERMSEEFRNLTALISLLTAFSELLPWIVDVRNDPDTGQGDAAEGSHAKRLDDWLQRLGITDELSVWRPPRPKRGRPRKVR